MMRFELRAIASITGLPMVQSYGSGSIVFRWNRALDICGLPEDACRAAWCNELSAVHIRLDIQIHASSSQERPSVHPLMM